MFPRSDLLPIQAAFQMVRLWWAMPSLEEKSRHWIDEGQTASLEMLFHDGLRTIICTRLASNRILTALFHLDNLDKCKLLSLRLRELTIHHPIKWRPNSDLRLRRAPPNLVKPNSGCFGFVIV